MERVDIKLRISGPTDDMCAFETGSCDGDDLPTFHALVPEPDGELNMQQVMRWRALRWGSEFDFAPLTVDRDDTDSAHRSVTYWLSTSVGVPLAAFGVASRRWPQLTFTITWTGPRGAAVGGAAVPHGRTVITGGRVVADVAGTGEPDVALLDRPDRYWADLAATPAAAARRRLEQRVAQPGSQPGSQSCAAPAGSLLDDLVIGDDYQLTSRYLGTGPERVAVVELARAAVLACAGTVIAAIVEHPDRDVSAIGRLAALVTVFAPRPSAHDTVTHTLFDETWTQLTRHVDLAARPGALADYVEIVERLLGDWSGPVDDLFAAAAALA